MEDVISSSPVRRFDLPRVFAILIRPRTAIAEIVSQARATWSTPMLVLTATTILAVMVAGYLKTRAAMMGEVQLPPDWQWLTPEMQENFMRAQQAQQGPAFMYAIPLVGALTNLWLGWLVFAGLLHLGSTLLGGRGSMQGALNLVAWASIPFAVRDILRVVFMLVKGQTIVSSGLSGFAASTGFVAQLLARLDIFMVWYFILLVIGIALADGLPRGNAVAAVFAVVLIALLAQAGLGALTSNVSGMAVQRPFF
jgi:hypothetical protein